jgi:hypothetical protein
MDISWPELRNHLDSADDVAVELCKFLRWNPVFTVLCRTGDSNLIVAQIFRSYLKACDIADIAGCFILCVPIAGDLLGILRVQDRIKEWLKRKTWGNFL